MLTGRCSWLTFNRRHHFLKLIRNKSHKILQFYYQAVLKTAVKLFHNWFTSRAHELLHQFHYTQDCMTVFLQNGVNNTSVNTEQNCSLYNVTSMLINGNCSQALSKANHMTHRCSNWLLMHD